MGQPSAAAAHSFYALRALHRTMSPARQRQLLAGLQRHSQQQVRYVSSTYCGTTYYGTTLLTVALLTVRYVFSTYCGTTC